MRLTHSAAVALGFTTIALLGMFLGLVSPSHTEIYHLSGSSTVLFLAVLCNMCALWLLLTALLHFAERPGWPGRVLWSALILSLPSLLLRAYARAIAWTAPPLLRLLVVGLSLVLFLLLHLCWRPAFQPVFARVQRFVASVLGMASLFGAAAIVQLLWFGWQARNLNAPLPLHQPLVAATTPQHPRIIWILLDELSYQQVYEQRFPGLQLPAFDRLASESTLFTHVIPAQSFTERVLPSLFTGMSVGDSIHASSDGRRLTLQDSSTGRSRLLDPHDTVFQDALDAGYSTGLAGWYNPYCRILNQVLDRCFWTNRFPLGGGMVGEQSFTINLLAPLRAALTAAPSLLRLQRTAHANTSDSELHIADYQDLTAAGDRFLADTSTTFLFLHLPIPHPPGIYDRQRATITTGRSSYIDNLALADTYLAHVRHLLEQQGQWDSSIVVVMGDHSWRTWMWSKGPAWAPEDQAASHGAQFDDRPAYIVKLPYQHTPARIDAPFRATRTRALFDAIFARRIHSTDDLSNWAKE